MKQIKILLLGIIILGVTCFANATVVDLPTIDGIGYFLDKNKKQTWVDVNYFLNESYSSVQEWTTNNPEYNIATTSQLEDLHDSMGRNYDTLALIIGDAYHPDENEQIIMGWYDDGSNEFPSYSWLFEGGGMWATDRGRGSGEAIEYNGAWVVKEAPVPEPATMLLFGLGLLGLAGVNRRRE